MKCRACELPIKEFDFNRLGPSTALLGKGSYGVVTLHKDGLTGDEVVVKSNLVKEEGDALSSDFIIETSTLASLQGHPNIVKFLGCTVHTTEIENPKTGDEIEANSTIVLEKAMDSMHGWLSKKVVPMTSEEQESAMYQVIRGVDWMHRNGIWHRDLKPQNVLAFNDGRFAVTDFGLARGGPFQFMDLSKRVGTLWWRAPEIMVQSAFTTRNSVRYDAASDVWALGIIFWELLASKIAANRSAALSHLRGDDDNAQLWKWYRAFAEEFTDEFLMSQIHRDRDAFLDSQSVSQKEDAWKKAWANFIPVTPKTMWSDGKAIQLLGYTPTADEMSLLQGLLRVDPKQRLTTEQALRHPYFNHVRPLIDQLLPAPTMLPELSMPLSCSEWPGEITPGMWSILIDWLFDVCNEFRFDYSSLLLGIYVLRCYLSDVKHHDRRMLQAQGMSALWIADQYNNDAGMPTSVEDWTFISNNLYTTNEIVRTQKEMFLAVGGKLHLPSSWAKVMELIEFSWTDEQIDVAAYSDVAKVIGHILVIIEASPQSFTMTTDEIAELCFQIISQREIDQSLSTHLTKIREWMNKTKLKTGLMLDQKKLAVQQIMNAKVKPLEQSDVIIDPGFDMTL